MRKQLSILLMMLCVLPVLAQNTAEGNYPFASFDNHGFDSLNLGNLNIRFAVPIVNRQGRGLPFSYAIQYQGLVWTPTGSGGSAAWTNDPAWGFTGVLNGTSFAGYLTKSTSYHMCSDGDDPHPTHSIYSYNYVYYDPFGGSHAFNYTLTGACPKTVTEPASPAVTTGDGSSSDGSGYKLVNQGAYIQTRNGKLIFPASSATGQTAASITDSNGNEISKSSTGVFTDTLGVTALTVSGGSPLTFTYPVTLQANNASTATSSLSYAAYTVRTNFGCSGVSEYGSNSISLVDRITLADGSFYHFTYEHTPGATDGAVTGRLASITLPSGGVISYAYSGGCSNSGINADGTPSGIARTTTDGTRNYSQSSGTTTLTDEKGNYSVYHFASPSGYPVETHRTISQGSGGSAPPLLDQYTCYNGGESSSGSFNCDGQAVSLPISEVDVAASYNNGSQSLTKNGYDPSGTLLTSSAQYQAGTLVSQTTTQYNLLGEPLNSATVDGSGNTISSSSFGYDETTPASTSGIPQHVAAPSSSRGNQTSTHVTTGSGTLSTTATYSDTGALLSTTAQDGGVTQYTYDSTQTFATQTSLPAVPSGIALSTSANYDTASTAALSIGGANSGETTTVNQYDPLLRVTSVTSPTGSVTTSGYSPNLVDVYQTLNSGGTSSHTQTILDAYGRTSQYAIYNGQSGSPWYLTDSCYDAGGLLMFQSSAYQASGTGGTKHCSGSGTAYQYDALGRSTSVTTNDGTATTTYSGRAVQTVDVNGITKIIQYDVLGRMSGVCEVSSTALGNDTPTACGMDIAGTGYLTSYSYNLANHTTTVQQGGQQRIFQTDAAGRTTSITEPERGNTTYSYSYNSTGLLVTRKRPKANQASSSVLTTTTTQYDTLGRVSKIVYDDNLTPQKSFVYDSVTSDWNVSTQHAAGRLTAVTDGANTATVFGYDSGGRVVEVKQCLPTFCPQGHAHDVAYSYVYNLDGTVQNESYLSQGYTGSTVTNAYQYTVAQELFTITHTQTPPGGSSAQTQNIYTANGLGPNGMTSVQTGNGATTNVMYDALGRQTGITSCLGGTPTTGGLSCQQGQLIYGWTATGKGSQTQQTNDTVLGPDAVSYDALNRLQSINYSSYGLAMGWTYDRYGNRLTQTLQSGSTVSAPQPQFNYSASNNYNASLYYDAAGNVAGGQGWTYDAEGAVLQYFDGTQNYFDPLGHVVRQTNVNDGVTTLYAYGANNRREAVFDGSLNVTTNEIFANGQQFAYYHAADGSLTYRYQNQVGTEAAREHSGTITTYTSLPFADDPGTHLAGSSLNTVSGEDDDQAHFAGMDDSMATTPWQQGSFQHGQFRDYYVSTGQWLSPDPSYASYNSADPQSFNRYVYAFNNPLRFSDPSGLDPCSGGDKPNAVTRVHAMDDVPCLAVTVTVTATPDCDPSYCFSLMPVSFTGLVPSVPLPQAPSTGLKSLGVNPCAHANPAALNYFNGKYNAAQHIMDTHMIPFSPAGGKSVYSFNAGANPGNVAAYFPIVMAYNALTLTNGILTGIRPGNTATLSFPIPGSQITSGGSSIGFDANNGMATTNINTLVVQIPSCSNVVTSYPGVP